MKKVILLLVVALSVVTASAQINLGLSGGLLSPTTDGAKTGFGGSISGDYFVTSDISVGLNIGYFGMGSESWEEEGFKMSMSQSIMPIALTGRYYFLPENIKPYAGIDLGYYTFSGSTKFMGASISASTSEFGIAPVIGLQYGLTEKLALDVNVKYHHIFVDGMDGFLGFNVGIVYKLK